MLKKFVLIAGLAGICAVVMTSVASQAVPTITGLSPDNRWFHTPKEETGTVTLSAAAPSGGALVVLASSSPEIVVPSTVTVPAGQTSVTFPIRGASYNSRGLGDVTAMYGGSSKSIRLQVDPGSDVRSVGVEPGIVTGGSSFNCRVELWGPAPAGGVSVPVFTSGAGKACLTVPAAVTLTAGQAVLEFAVSTTAVQDATAVTICANSPTASWASKGCVGNSASKSITIVPASGMPLKNVWAMGKYTRSYSPSASTGAGSSISLKVSLPYKAPDPVTVQLSSSHPGIAPVPPSVVIETGQEDGSVLIMTSAVSETTTVTLTAVLGGASKSVPVEVLKEAVVQSLSLSPASVNTSGVVTGTIILDQPAPMEGTKVRILSSDPVAATAPAFLLIPQGATKGIFPMAATITGTKKSITVSAEFAGVKKTALLIVGSPETPVGQQETTARAEKSSPKPPASETILGNWTGDFEELNRDPEFKKKIQGARNPKEFVAQSQETYKMMKLTVARGTITMRTAEPGQAASEVTGNYIVLNDSTAEVTIKFTPVQRAGTGTESKLKVTPMPRVRIGAGSKIKATDSQAMTMSVIDRNHIRAILPDGQIYYYKRVGTAIPVQ